MQLEESQTPIFRQVIIPWYDSETSCLIMLVFLDFVFLFATSGIWVARQYPEYYKYIWIPILLIVMSSSVILSITIRLGKRLIYKLKTSE